MAFNRSNAIVEARGRIQDQSPTNPHLKDDDLDLASRAALARFSLDRPADLVAEFSGEGDPYYVLETVLAGWKDGFSGIKSIEYPMAVVSDEDAPNYLDRDDWRIVEVLNGSTRELQFYFTALTPISTEKIRVAYRGVHTLNDLDGETTTTMPAVYESAFYHLVASFALQQMAAGMAQKGDPTIGADLVNHPDLVSRLQRNAGFWLEQYAHAVGISLPGMEGTGGAGLAGRTIDWDVAPASGRDFIFHGRRSR